MAEWESTSQPSRHDRADVWRSQVFFGDLEQHPRPAVAAEHLWGEAHLRRVAVVEGDHDRLWRQRAAVVPGALHLIERDALIAAARQPRHLFAEFGPRDVEPRVCLGRGRVAKRVVDEDRNRPAMGLPPRLRTRVSNQPGAAGGASASPMGCRPRGPAGSSARASANPLERPKGDQRHRPEQGEASDQAPPAHDPQPARLRPAIRQSLGGVLVRGTAG